MEPSFAHARTGGKQCSERNMSPTFSCFGRQEDAYAGRAD